MDIRSNKKRTLTTLFISLTILLSLMPILVSLSEGFTRFVESITLYQFFQTTLVPFEIKTVGALLTLFQIPAQIQFDGLIVHGTFLRLTWNCVGWQSVLFLFLSFCIGLQGRYKRLSVMETITIGILGTFLLNIARIVFIVLLGAYFPGVFVIVFHDYLAAILTIVWLIVYWKFAYTYVLVETV